jgi:hypothetical protein
LKPLSFGKKMNKKDSDFFDRRNFYNYLEINGTLSTEEDLHVL